MVGACGRGPWLLWVRMHEAENYYEFGCLGVALQVGHQPEEFIHTDHIDAVLSVMRRILKDPEVQLRGGVI